MWRARPTSPRDAAGKGLKLAECFCAAFALGARLHV